MSLIDSIRTIPDHPKPGIQFRDVTTLMADPVAFTRSIEMLCESFRAHPLTLVAGIEARGFIFGAAVAHTLGVGFVPLRKKGKLPGNTYAESYALEYGIDELHMHDDAVGPDDRVLLVDDLIATGGTAEAGVKLIRRGGATVEGAAFVIDLPELGGADRIRGLNVDVVSLVAFSGH